MKPHDAHANYAFHDHDSTGDHLLESKVNITRHICMQKLLQPAQVHKHISSSCSFFIPFELNIFLVLINISHFDFGPLKIFALVLVLYFFFFCFYSPLFQILVLISILEYVSILINIRNFVYSPYKYFLNLLLIFTNITT